MWAGLTSPGKIPRTSHAWAESIRGLHPEASFSLFPNFLSFLPSSQPPPPDPTAAALPHNRQHAMASPPQHRPLSRSGLPPLLWPRLASTRRELAAPSTPHGRRPRLPMAAAPDSPWPPPPTPQLRVPPRPAPRPASTSCLRVPPPRGARADGQPSASPAMASVLLPAPGSTMAGAPSPEHPRRSTSPEHPRRSSACEGPDCFFTGT
jgi:hypothetical protein